MKNFILILSCLVTTLLSAGDELRLKGVSAYLQYPLTGKVSIFVSFQGKEEDVKKTECKFVATIGATNTLLPSSHITPEGEPFGADTEWTRKFLWDAQADVGPIKIGDVELKVVLGEGSDVSGGVQLWKGGPYWSECNVGAELPEESGYYFYWGDTTGYRPKGGSYSSGRWSGVTWVPRLGEGTNFKFDAAHCTTYGKDNSELRAGGYIDSTGRLSASYDAATVNLGAHWRTPTESEIWDLCANCSDAWTSRNGVSGILFTGKGEFSAKSIFLPACGYGVDASILEHGTGVCIRGSNPCADDDGSSFWIDFYRGGEMDGYVSRYVGMPIRPISGASEQIALTHLDLDCAVSGSETEMTGVTVSNIVVHYVVNSIRPEFAVPVTKDAGFVNVITEVVGNNVAVPQTWTENYPLFSSKFGSDFTQALVAKTGKRDASGREMLVWEDYVAGTDPTNPNDKFKASVTVVEGRPVVSWTPELDAERAALRKYTVYGKVKLTDSNWVEVGNGDEEGFNFFKVTVEMK